VIKENQKFRATSCTTKLNKCRSAICAPSYKRRWLKHQKFDQPYEIKAQNPCYPWEWRPQSFYITGKDPITNCEKRNESFEAAKKWPYNLEKLCHALLSIKPTSMEPERVFSDTGLFVTKLRNWVNDESVLWLSCVSVINIIKNYA